MHFKNNIFFGQYLLLCSLIFHSFSNTKAIIGHKVKDAKQSDFPFIANIAKRTDTFNPSRHMICTAALITNQDVLTAEHCLIDDASTAIQVLIGSVDIWSCSIYYAAWWITFDQWAAANRRSIEFGINDICIVRLSVTVNSTRHAEVNFLQYGDLKGKSVTAVGWGKINNGTIPNTLQNTKLKVLSNSDCIRRACKLGNRNYGINQNLLCSARDPYAQLTNGDSGGPLIYKKKVVAINSGIFPHPEMSFHPDKVNLHTNLVNYRAFYASVLES